MFRSETMSLNRVMFAKESMWDTLNYLANTNQIMMHYQDSHVQNTSKSSLALYGDNTKQRCQDLLAQIQETKMKMADFNHEVKPLQKPIIEYIKEVDAHCKEINVHGQQYFEEEEKQMLKRLETLNQFLASYEGIIKTRVELFEQLNSLNLVEEMVPHQFLDDGSSSSLSFSKSNTLHSDDE